MIKNILLLFVGFAVGIPVGGGAIYLLYQQKNILPAPIDDLGILVETDAGKIQQTTENIKPIEIYVPKNLASQEYQQKLESIVNSLNEVAKVNNEKIYTGMGQLKQMSREGNWNGIFDLMADIRKSVSDTKVILSGTERDVASYQIETSRAPSGNADFVAKSRDFAGAAQNLIVSYQSYLETLGQFLTGKTPTQELANELNSKITDVGIKSQELQKAAAAVYDIIDSENGKIQQDVASTTVANPKAR